MDSSARSVAQFGLEAGPEDLGRLKNRMAEAMPVRLIQIVLILAPLFLALSIWAYHRLRGFVYHAPDSISFFRRPRWDSGLILVGGLLLLKGAGGASALGTVAQACGFILALEFFYVAYVNHRAVVSGKGLLLGMNFSPWQRFTGYTWRSDSHLELVSRPRRSYHLHVPEDLKPRVQEIVDLNILQ